MNFNVSNCSRDLAIVSSKDIYPTKKWVVESNVCVYDLKVSIKANERVNFFSKNEKLVMIYSEEELKKNYEKNK